MYICSKEIGQSTFKILIIINSTLNSKHDWEGLCGITNMHHH